MAVATTSPTQFFREPGDLLSRTKRLNGGLALNLVHPQSRIPLNVFPHAMTRNVKRRRMVPCSFSRGISSEGFFDTCRHCGNQIFRKAQSRPRICLQCEKKRATPIHDRCKDCQEPIIRSNVRKARICQKCKKAREKPNTTSQNLYSNGTFSMQSNWDSRILSNTLFQTNCFSRGHITVPSTSRRLNSLNHWFQRMSKHMMLQHHHQQQSCVNMVNHVSTEHRSFSSESTFFLSNPCPTAMYFPSYYPPNPVNAVPTLFDIVPCPLPLPQHHSSFSPSTNVLAKIKTEYFETPEDIVAYLRDRVLNKLSSLTGYPYPVKLSTSGERASVKKCSDFTSVKEPILIPQVNPYQITQTVSETEHVSPSMLNEGIVAEVDSSTFSALEDVEEAESSWKEVISSPNPTLSPTGNDTIPLNNQECYPPLKEDETHILNLSGVSPRRLYTEMDSREENMLSLNKGSHQDVWSDVYNGDSSIPTPHETSKDLCSEENDVKPFICSENSPEAVDNIIEKAADRSPKLFTLTPMSSDYKFNHLMALLHPDTCSTFESTKKESSFTLSKEMSEETITSYVEQAALSSLPVNPLKSS